MDPIKRLLGSVLLAAAALSLACSAGPEDAVPADAGGAQEATWPALPTEGFIHSRAATVEDVEAGNAAFSARVGDQVVGKPLALIVPQYAWRLQAEGEEPTPVIVIQAESAQGREFIGYREVGTDVQGVAPLAEFELLGRRPPR